MSKNRNITYPEGFAVEIRLRALLAYHETQGTDIVCALPRFIEMVNRGQLAMVRALWRDYSQYLVRRGVSKSRVQRYWRELRINEQRFNNQRYGQRDREARQGLLERIRGMRLEPNGFKYDRAVGIEIECYGPNMGDKLPLWAREKGDGSLGSASNGVEFNLLLKREYLEPRLYKFCELLKNYGHKVDKTCGLHIHLDMRGKSEEYVEAVAKKMDKWLYALRELVPASRRGNSYCAFGFSREDRYHAVNFTAFQKFKTLEIRLHSGTVDYTKIVSWLRLLELIAAMPKAPAKSRNLSCLNVLETLPLPGHELAYWLARHKELNPAIYNTVATRAEAE